MTKKFIEDFDSFITYVLLRSSFGAGGDLCLARSYFRFSFVAYLAYGVLMEAILIIVAVLHLRSLRLTMETLREGNGQANPQVQLTGKTHASLVWITFAFASVTSASPSRCLKKPS